MNLLKEDKTYQQHEVEIQERWRKTNINDKLNEKHENDQLFRFMDGPPFCSSKALHYGHIMISMTKNAVLQYKHMQNYKTLNKLGYDTHGLPVEMCINKELGTNTRPEIENYGLRNYNNKCREFIESCSKSWEPIFERVGRICDFKNHYKTMDVEFMESEFWVFKQLWEKNMIYKSFKVMPFSTKCETPLSNFEASENYKEIDTKSVYVAFELKNEPNTYLVAWTTTPWTLPGNIALCVNPETEYVLLEDSIGKKYIVAKDCASNLKLKTSEESFYRKGSEMTGLEYVPLFNYFQRDKYQVISADFVEGTGKVGTGIVHMSPAHGAIDFETCVKNNLLQAHEVNKYCIVDDQGMYNEIIQDMKGNYVFEYNDEIIKRLKNMNVHVRTEGYRHNYPFCYRTDTPLIYKAVSSYFVRSSSLKDEMLAHKINWYPQSSGDRYKQWVSNIQDWGISRKRFFGTPIPIWSSEDDTEHVVIGSINELMEKANLSVRPKDLHLENLSNIEIPSKTGKGMLKLSGDVMDCWFDSACVPYGQIHYPFENNELLDDHEYLSDFVCEGADQVRNWFYVLNVISTAITGKAAFKNVLCTGIVYNKDKCKFSKRLSNYKDPFDIMQTYGSDVLRLYLLNSPLINSNPLYFSEETLEKTKQKIIPYINAAKFLTTQIIDFNKKGLKFDSELYKKSNTLTDKWIVSRLSSTIDYINTKMESFKIDRVISKLFDFVEDMTNWYIKFNRDRLRGLMNNDEWGMSLSTLYCIVLNFTKLMTPFTPFLSEYIYDNIKLYDNDIQDSVLLTCYPEKGLFVIDNEIEQKMDRMRHVVKLVRILRDRTIDFKTIRVPIRKIIIYHNDKSYLDDIRTIENLAKEEMNCHKFEYKNFTNNVTYLLIVNNKSLGQKYRSESNEIRKYMNTIPNSEITKLINDKNHIINLNINNKTYYLTSDDLEIKINPQMSEENVMAEVDRELMVAIDTNYDDELHNNYQLRLLLRSVQKVRKSMGLNPWNKIIVNFYSNNNTIFNYIKDNTESISKKLKCDVSFNEDNDINSNDHLWVTRDRTRNLYNIKTKITLC